ncbi:type I restriction enzyme, S subunit [Hymenobacter daecheongensis DSM 21074]|uniref:Type I restriction enzyme, S subunit n=2 Tax=Hymenobacter daecheongensis TaxID=496053 RepID=A0A1M6J124_9BACT|nr:type I restriction enzyme, S subunit [Hymenobacter daecheongensis DSM 21074]
MEMTTAAAVEKQGYKLTKLGWIPEEWDVRKLDDVAEIHNHLRFPLSETVRKGMQGPYPYYGPTKAQDYLDHFRVEGKYVLIGEDGDHFLKFQTHPMTLLVDGQYNVNNHAHLIKGTESCETEWVYWFFNSRDLTNDITRQGAGRYKLTKDALKRLLLVVPPVAEQRAIINILNGLKIQEKVILALVKAKSTYKSGLMQQLLTGQLRFPEFQGQPWHEQRISSLITESRIPGSNGKAAKKLTVKLYGKGVLAKNERQIGSVNTKYYARKAGQFIYSKLDFLNGAFGLIPEELDGYESTLDLPTFDISPEVDASLLLAYFSREEFYARFADIAAGGRKAVRIGPEELLKKKILLPSLPEQQRIAAVLNACDQEIELLQAQLRQWQQQKKGLMQQLLTGQLRVPNSL